MREFGDRTRTKNEIPFADNDKLQRAVSPLLITEAKLAKESELFKVGDIVYYTLKKQHRKHLALLANINDNNYVVYDITPTNTGGYKIYNINKHFLLSEMLSSVNKDLQDKIKKALGLQTDHLYKQNNLDFSFLLYPRL